jgi:hypothetical protein
MNLIPCEAAAVDVKRLTLHPVSSAMDRSRAGDGNDLRSSHIYILHQRSVHYEHHLTELHICKMWDWADFICPYSVVNT